MKRCVRVGLMRKVEYTLISSRARTSVLLQALPDGKIRLYAPVGVSLRELDETVRSHIKEIDMAHAEFERASSCVSDTVLLRGMRIKLEIIPANANRITVTESGVRMLTVHDDAQAQLDQLKRFMANLALGDIRRQLEVWAPTVGKSYGRIAIREQRSRWGSCSSKNNLNFNWKLVLAPPQALEYVVIHELCHLLYFNHSEKFWAEVEKRMPDYKIWKKWLSQHGSELTL